MELHTITKSFKNKIYPDKTTTNLNQSSVLSTVKPII